MKIRKVLLSEEKLIEAMQIKSRIGSIALYDMYSKTLYGYIIRMIDNQEMAEDACHDSLIKIWNSFDSYDASKGRLFTWMLAITRNIAKDTLRSRRYKQYLQTVPIEHHIEMIEQRNNVLLNTDTIGIKPWLENLKKDQQDILNLVYFKGYTHNEVANELQIPLGTVKTRCRMGIKVLRGIYNDSNSKVIENTVNLNA